MNCRALGVGEETRHDIDHDLDELSCYSSSERLDETLARDVPDRKRPSAP